uniref:Ribonuclease H-like domain-containing protein n=1 Tax=Tanacetum cinerariifolium TaxID=118510 RepID=A0A6L2JR80_TANCI|nr:ribonuclease H-like domain-containing protein [Tanacetum cinerariifolium]
MVTHFRVGTNRPTERLNLHVSTISPLPKSYTDAFNDPNLQNAMSDDYNVFIKNNTWILVPRPAHANVVRCMWLFRHKLLTYSTLSLYRVSLVANGITQLSVIDVDETFSPVVKPATIWTVLSLATSRHWPVHQLDHIIASLYQEFSMTERRTFVDTESKLGDDGDPVSDPTLYRSLAGALCYLTFIRPDISYVVQQRQLTLSRSSAEAEYRGVVNAEPETCWLRILLQIDIYFVRDLVVAGQVRVLHVSSRYQYADIFTKDLHSALFEEFRSSLSVRCPPAQTTMECRSIFCEL